MKDKKNFALGRTNFIMLTASMAIILIGFILMSGEGSDAGKYNPEIFSDLRIKIAPAVCFVGFVSMICGVLYRPKDGNQKEL